MTRPENARRHAQRDHPAPAALGLARQFHPPPSPPAPTRPRGETQGERIAQGARQQRIGVQPRPGAAAFGERLQRQRGQGQHEEQAHEGPGGAPRRPIMARLPGLDGLGLLVQLGLAGRGDHVQGADLRRGGHARGALGRQRHRAATAAKPCANRRWPTSLMMKLSHSLPAFGLGPSRQADRIGAPPRWLHWGSRFRRRLPIPSACRAFRPSFS